MIWGRQSLLESYRDARRKFIEAGGTPDEVKSAIDSFKAARDRKAIKGEEADIGRWIPQGWDSFREFVSDLATRKTKAQQRKVDKSNVIVHRDDDEVLIITPLREEASCYYGKATKWCTAATEGKNYFWDYVIYGKVLFYIIAKTGEKWGVTWEPRINTYQAFDAEDNDIKLSDIPYNIEQYATREVANRAFQSLDDWYDDIKRGEVKDLRGADLIGADLDGADLRGAVLSGANLFEVDLEGADLHGAVLQDSELNYANLSSVNLLLANLEGADLSGANLEGADLSGANLEFAELKGADLSSANLKDANLEDANLEGAVMPAGWEKITKGTPKIYPDGTIVPL